jgi:molecular chaperone GrpE
LAEEQVLEPEKETEELNHDTERGIETPRSEVAEEAAREEPTADEVLALRQELEEAKAKEAEYLDGWQRARAELSNARKRFQRDQEQAYANAKADVLARLLPIVDDFERARETLPENPSTPTWVEGVLLIQRKLQTLLDQDCVVPIAAEGAEFDPFLHQAITHEPSDTVPEGHVIGVTQKGYQMGDRVLRPSMVRVSSGPAEAEPEVEADFEAEGQSANEK